MGPPIPAERRRRRWTESFPNSLGTQFGWWYRPSWVRPSGPAQRSLPQSLAAQVPSVALRQQPGREGEAEDVDIVAVPLPRSSFEPGVACQRIVDRVHRRSLDGVASERQTGRRFSGSLPAPRLTRAAPRRWSHGAGGNRTLRHGPSRSDRTGETAFERCAAQTVSDPDRRSGHGSGFSESSRKARRSPGACWPTHP
jgi:hypothetical protein